MVKEINKNYFSAKGKVFCNKGSCRRMKQITNKKKNVEALSINKKRMSFIFVIKRHEDTARYVHTPYNTEYVCRL